MYKVKAMNEVYVTKQKRYFSFSGAKQTNGITAGINQTNNSSISDASGKKRNKHCMRDYSYEKH